MSHDRRLITGSLLLSLTFATAVSGEITTGRVETTQTREVARIMGVTEAEAVRRLALQDKILALTPILERDAGYIGSAIVSTPTAYTFRVRMTAAGIARSRSLPMLHDRALRDIVVFDIASTKVGALSDLQARVLRRLQAGRMEGAVTVDSLTERVVVRIKNVDAARALMANIPGADRLIFERVDGFPQAMVQPPAPR